MIYGLYGIQKMMMMVMMASPVCVASTSKMKIDEFCHWPSALSTIPHITYQIPPNIIYEHESQ